LDCYCPTVISESERGAEQKKIVSGTLEDFATVCYTGKSSQYQKANLGLQNALNLAYAHLQFKNFPGVIPQTPVKKGNGREREGRGWARKWKEGKIEGWGQERKVRREGTGGPPFTNPRYASVYTGPRMRHG
jgi:hypothetical protein